MPNNLLIDRLFALGADATVSERLILKFAAALLKQLDARSYVVSEDDDSRIQFTREEFHSLPDRIELIHGIPRPKDWEIPEHMAALKRENREMDELTKQFNGDHTAAWKEYVRRMKERRGRRS